MSIFSSNQTKNPHSYVRVFIYEMINLEQNQLLNRCEGTGNHFQLIRTGFNMKKIYFD